MAEKSGGAKPDLQPGMPLTQKLGMGLILVVAVGFAGYVIYQMYQARQTEEPTRITSEVDMDEDFHSWRSQEDATAEEEHTVGPKPDEESAEEEPEITGVQPVVPIPRGAERNYQRRGSNGRSQEGGAGGAAQDQGESGGRERLSARERRIREWNERRRQGGRAMVAASAEESEPVLEQDRWDGVASTESSLPVDMTRVITEDRFISAILVNEINSTLEGDIVAQIEENIYGGHGRRVLIPKGSRAIGRYSGLERLGQERIHAMWDRIITPDGININLQAETVDAMGRAGVTGDIDRRFLEKYGLPLMMSVFQGYVMYEAAGASDGQQQQQVMIDNFGRDSSNIAQAILEETIDIRPVVTIPAGSRIQLSPTQDIWFPEPEAESDNGVSATAVSSF